MLLDVTIQPVMSVLLFAYVLGGAIAVSGSPSGYREWLLGIIVMSLTGLVVGWRIRGSVLEALAAYGLLLMWGFAMIWLGIRQLWGNTGPAPADSHRPMQYPVPFTIGWTVLTTAVIAPLALKVFRNRTLT